MENKTPWWQIAILWAIIGMVVGVLIGMAIGWRWAGSVSEAGNGGQVTEEQNGASDQSGANVDGSAEVVVRGQSAGRTVTVEHVALSQTGWIAVHEVIDGEGTGNVLGAARRDAGEYDNVTVNLLRATDSGKEYAIVLYSDNGNSEFDLKADLPITDEDGEPILVRFMTGTESNTL